MMKFMRCTAVVAQVGKHMILSQVPFSLLFIHLQWGVLSRKRTGHWRLGCV